MKYVTYNIQYRIAANVLLSIGSMAGCSFEEVDASPASESTLAEPSSDALHQWSYDGELGPTHWSDLDAKWALCGDGSTQSPIDIPESIAPKPMSDLSIEYEPSELQLVNNGHTIQVNSEPGSRIVVGGVPYELMQFHFHAHSEHRVGGRFAPLELHLVHRAASGALAVVGILVEQGEPNQALAPVFAGLPKQSGSMLQLLDGPFDASDLLPLDLTGFRYDGSLTTPPCTEQVDWHVLSTRLSASAEQIEMFTALYANNARPLQPLNDRSVK